MSALYADEYGERRPGSYPFAQFLNQDWVAMAATSTNLCWLVAETAGVIDGTLGAVINIGGPEDRVAEFFGLVVGKDSRRRGIATALGAALVHRLESVADVLLAETRTAEAGGWRAMQKQGFAPIGIEPYAHSTPAGWEPMLVLARIAPEALKLRKRLDIPGGPTQTVGRTIVSHFDTDLRTRASSAPRTWPAAFRDGGWQPTKVERNDKEGARLHEALRSRGRHQSGVVDFDRLRGIDPFGVRYVDAYLVAREGAEPVACTRLQWDREDRRCRILSLDTSASFYDLPLFAAAVGWAEEQANREPFAVVVDVRADRPYHTHTLAQLGFTPTLYYPGLVRHAAQRIDAAHYTLVCGRELSDQWDRVRDLPWQEAREAVAAVAAAASGAAISPPSPSWRDSFGYLTAAFSRQT